MLVGLLHEGQGCESYVLQLRDSGFCQGGVLEKKEKVLRVTEDAGLGYVYWQVRADDPQGTRQRHHGHAILGGTGPPFVGSTLCSCCRMVSLLVTELPGGASRVLAQLFVLHFPKPSLRPAVCTVVRHTVYVSLNHDCYPDSCPRMTPLLWDWQELCGDWVPGARLPRGPVLI